MTLARNLLAEQSKRRADQPAVVTTRGRTTYADLDLRSDRLAAALVRHGLKPGECAVVFMDNSLEAVIAVFAVAKAGAVLTPVDPAVTGAELALVLADCGATAVLTETRRAARTADALRRDSEVRMVVLVGGDQPSTGETCISFEEATGRRGQSDASLLAADAEPLALVYPRVPGGLGLPARLLDADVVGDLAGPAVAVAPVIAGVRPMAGARGLTDLFQAVAAGATMTLGTASLPARGQAAASPI